MYRGLGAKLNIAACYIKEGLLFTLKKQTFARALGGVSGVASFVTTDEHVQ